MPNINVLLKPSSGMCNLECEYCFYHDEAKNRTIKAYGFMKEEILEEIIKKTIAFSEESCAFGYQGGEPTLRGIDFYKKAVELQKKYNKKKIKIRNSFQTNGININNNWAEFFKDNSFLVGISLDGIEYTHNYFRKDKQGNNSYAQVINAIEILKRYQVEYNILTVVNAITAKKISSIYKDYKLRNFQYLQFIPCIHPIGKEKEKFSYTLSPKGYSQFLKTLFDLWYCDLKKGKVIHIQQFEEYIKILHGKQPDMCGMSGICSFQHVIEADGEVYPCDFYVLDNYKLGNLKEYNFEEINQNRKRRQFIDESKKVYEECGACKYFMLCRGGCKRNRNPKNVFCNSYYEFFDYTISRFKEIAESVNFN